MLRSLPAPGALLDSAGQLIGHWMQVGVDVDRNVLPVSVDAIRLYGAQPEQEQRVACTARVTALTDMEMRADATLRTSDGRVWCRIEGWTVRRFATDEVVWRVKFDPEVAGVGESQLGGWCLVRERWPGTASRELMMRRYLNAVERAEYEGLSARRQRQWLLGRIAAKDAARHWLWAHGHGPVFPCEITVSNDPTGQPRVKGPFVGELHVSIAHSGELGVAIVSPDGPVGIDVEAVDDRALDTERIGFTDAEHRLLDAECAGAGARAADGAGDRTTALVRFWAAKEAVAKARGTGFLGNPRNFEVTGKTGDVLDIVTDGHRYGVTTQLIGGPERHPRRGLDRPTATGGIGMIRAPRADHHVRRRPRPDRTRRDRRGHHPGRRGGDARRGHRRRLPARGGGHGGDQLQRRPGGGEHRVRRPCRDT